MATVALSALTAVMNLIFGAPMADLVRRDVLLPNLLPVRVGRNSTMTWTVKSAARAAGGAYAEGADMAGSDYDAHVRLQASLAWAQYRTGAAITGLAEALSRLNGSPALDPSAFASEINDAIDYLAILISAHTYSGNVSASPVQLSGLASAIASSGSYGGIDPASYADWVSTANSLASASLSFATLRTNGPRPVKDACGMWPVFATCDGTTFDKIGALFGDQRRYIDEVMSVDGQLVNIKLRGGYRALDVDGIPYVEDRHATANTIYYFGRDSVHYEQVPAVGPDQAGVVVAAMKALTGIVLDESEVEASLEASTQRLQPSIEMMGKAGDSHKAMVKVYAQIAVDYRNRCGKLLLT
jgi:hypothetical protein